MSAYLLHPLAAQELAEAARFYKERAGSALVRSFLAEFERVANLLCSNADFGTPLEGGRRSFPLRRFPYSLIYRTKPEGDLLILAVGHQSRRPGYWRRRT